MKQEYPEKIFISPHISDVDASLPTAYFEKIEGGVEYTRSDLVEKSTSSPKWHRVEEGLPKDGTMCAIIKNKGKVCLHYAVCIFEETHHDHEGECYPDRFCSPYYDYDLDEVAAWMPLPEFKP